MPHSVRRHLQLDVEAYDASIRRFIPGYEAMLARAAEEIARAQPERVLDLGAGTGALAEAILKRCEDARVVELVDVDDEMLRRAESRLRRFGERVRLRSQSFNDPLPGCDAVAASLSLHHVADLGTKTALYARIAQALRTGGVFVNADVTMPGADPARAADYAMWAAHLAACGIDEAQAYRHFDEWSDEDTYFPLDRELQAMRKAGFDAECVWRQTPSTVLVGRKADQVANQGTRQHSALSCIPHPRAVLGAGSAAKRLPSIERGLAPPPFFTIPASARSVVRRMT